jgi:hypothetical protein
MNQILIPSIRDSMAELDRTMKMAQEGAQKVAQENAIVREATIGSLASNTAKYIYNSINDFWANIGNDYEVGMQLTSLGQGVQVYLNNLTYYEPHLIIFDSEFSDGTKMRIVQHVTQLNYAIIALPKQRPNEQKRKIGFRCDNE